MESLPSNKALASSRFIRPWSNWANICGADNVGANSTVGEGVSVGPGLLLGIVDVGDTSGILVGGEEGTGMSFVGTRSLPANLALIMLMSGMVT